MNYLLTALIALLAPISVAYNVPHGFLTGEAVTSHSGPNDLDGELPATDEVKREKRGYFFPSHFQSDSGLLSRSEHPNEYLKKWITHEHNRYRRMVPASDMNMLYWSDELAASAQRHADTCDFRHSRGRINVGENIWAAPYSNYSDAISIWFNEVHNPRCGCNHAYKHCCGHYVQVVWAKTNLVGCGFSRCRDVQGVWGRGHRNVFVCHYNPQGNTMPAFTWASGDNGKCSNCPANAPACYQGLCYMPKNYEAPTTTTESTTTSTTTEEPTTTCEPDEPEAEGADNNQEEEEENNDGFRMRV
ncbi:SCP domain-containing protein [Caenorhabditis elegans]|uniref:SCP domain-containing protein n=1 Tax=Caenorhabditis elegans TaxID=6239 RepID=H2L058_CAEEL|nr:SCP domain-containing protein [Caenorhabditis elegans]CCD71509.1 SCP domain-containing protein [Caenorhabditis elegans]|eukprot:NP_498167.1 Protein lon-1 [Caenorhabditis elegans]